MQTISVANANDIFFGKELNILSFIKKNANDILFGIEIRVLTF